MKYESLAKFWRAHRAAYPVVCLLVVSAQGCDDPDMMDAEAEDIQEDDVADEPEAEGPDGPSLLADDLDPQAGGNYPTFEILAPVRVDDLKPNHYPVLKTDAAKWHDMFVFRYDGGWLAHRPGEPPGEPNDVSWGTPLYAGVDGEVMDCWRTAPYVIEYAEVANKLKKSGNFITIRTFDDRWVYYAHLDTNSIPSALCPKVSVNGGYLNADIINDLVCEDGGAKECSLVETYIPAGSRPQVHRGQYIGKMAAIGQADGGQVHMDAGDIAIDPITGVDRTVQTHYHITFEHTWQAPKTGESPPIAWTASSGTSIPDAVTTDYLLYWPGRKHQQTYSGSYRLAKFGGSTGDDLLCHDTGEGNLWTDGDGTVSAEFAGTDWTRATNWCTGDSQRLQTGDFDGNGWTDLVCHDSVTGVFTVELGALNVGTGNIEYGGVAITGSGGWCASDTQTLIVGDFDSDGLDDFLCHDHSDGRRWIDRAFNGFTGTDQAFATGWCFHHYNRLHVGRFDTTSPGDDLLCHNIHNGQMFIDATPTAAQIANQTPIFGATDKTGTAWCNVGADRLFAADVTTGNSLDELVCHNSDTGVSKISVANVSGVYSGTSSTGAVTGDCTDPYDRLKFGDFNNDGRDDMLCFNTETGARSVDYAALATSTGGVFGGLEWASTGTGWCRSTDQALH